MRDILAVVTCAVLVSSATCEEHRPEGVKISDYDNYLEDKSLIGREISCTEEEKECFKFRRVLYTDGKCYMMLHVGPCKDSGFHFNKEKAQNGEFKAECEPVFNCETPNQMLMAFDQICYQTELIHEVCDVKKNLTVFPNVFGENHCRCFGDSCSPRPVVIQPEEHGRCRLPDLIYETFSYWTDPLAYRVFPCSAEEHECLKQKMMLHEETGKCYPLLEKGPCREGELFVANRTAFSERGWLLGSCAAPSCPEGQVRMQFDGQCYKHDDALNKVCPPNVLVRDVFGDVGCGFDQDLDVGNQLPRELTPDGVCRGQHRHF